MSTKEIIDIKNVQSLLDEISGIVKEHENIAFLTGEKFNVFDIIGIKNREVTLHSAMLGNLLNAKGSHGMKGRFLELFQNILDEKVRVHNENEKSYNSEASEESKDKNEENLLKIIYSRQFTSEEECNDTIMEIEKSIGKKNEDEGGRIDLYISKGENAIIIENKIYAEEQYNQLIRYFNYNDKAAIVFLTLYGDKPNSTKDNKGNNISNKVIYLSYKEDIIKWLELCMKEVYDKPLILYSLKQYQNLIKLITNQSINKVMSIEIVKLMKYGNNAIIASQILKNWDNLSVSVEENFHNNIKAKFSKYNNLTSINIDNKSIKSKVDWRGIQFDLFEYKDISLILWIHLSKWGLYYGVSKKNKETHKREKFSINEFKELSIISKPTKYNECEKWLWNIDFVVKSEINFNKFDNKIVIELANEEKMGIFIENLNKEITQYINILKTKFDIK